MLRYTQLLLWRVSALLALAVGLVGLALPVVPTVPFLIVAAWAASKGSPRLERYLLNHPSYGEHIRNWRECGAVPRRAKVFAITAMSISAIALQFMPVPQWLRLSAPIVMATIAVWLWTRPEP
jgi:uncharacterized protein